MTSLPPIHVIDFEGDRTGGVLEWGVATVVAGRIVGTATRRCRPTGRVAAAAQAVHRLDPAGLAGERPFVEDFALFRDWRACGVFAAHFAAVEHGLLKHTWPFPPLSPDWSAPGRQVADWGPWIDTARLAVDAGLTTDGRPPGLAAAVAAAEVGRALADAVEAWCPADRRAPHCALYDALAAALVLIAVLRPLPATRLTPAGLVAASAPASGARKVAAEDLFPDGG